MSANLVYLILIVLIGIVYPIYALMSAGPTRRMLLKIPSKLIAVYKETMAIQVVLTFMIVFSLIGFQEPLDAIGLSFLFRPIQIGLLLGSCLLGLWMINKIEIDDDKVDKLSQDNKDVFYILPKTELEYKWGIVLSFVAGIFEEIIYRGFLYWQLTLYLPTLPSVLLVAFVFSLGHAGTKIKNMVSTFLLSLIFSATYLIVGSLWLAMLLHVLIDLYAVTSSYKLNRKLDHK